MPCDLFEARRRVLLFEDLRLDPVDIDPHLVGDAAMLERLDERLIGVLEAGIFADDGDRHLAFGMAERSPIDLPAVEIGRRRVVDAEGGKHLGVKPFVRDRRAARRRSCSTSSAWMTADGRTLQNSDELPPLVRRDRPVGADEQNVGLDADRAQLLHGVLGRLRLQLAGGRDERHQRQMDEDGVAARQFVAELADRLEERQALDVADRAADLAQDEIELLVAARR